MNLKENYKYDGKMDKNNGQRLFCAICIISGKLQNCSESMITQKLHGKTPVTDIWNSWHFPSTLQVTHVGDKNFLWVGLQNSEGVNNQK